MPFGLAGGNVFFCDEREKCIELDWGLTGYKARGKWQVFDARCLYRIMLGPNIRMLSHDLFTKVFPPQARSHY